MPFSQFTSVVLGTLCKTTERHLWRTVEQEMGQRKIGTPSSSLEKINVVAMGKDDVGKSG